MNLICNELSFHPIAENAHVADRRFRNLLKTFSVLREKYGFTHVQFPQNFYAQLLTNTQTFYEWVSTLANQTLKNLILDLCKRPYTDDLENYELDIFYESEYALVGEDLPTNEPPIGFPIAYIKSLPTISFDSHIFWRNRKIAIQKSNSQVGENFNFTVYNLCLENDVVSEEFNDWISISMADLITTEELLTQYLNYSKYRAAFSDNFMNQFFNWKISDIEYYKYLLLLMKDVELHPFTGGIGQTENLKYRGKEASKRITRIDRLSYTLDNNVIFFLSCQGHYEFH